MARRALASLALLPGLAQSADDGHPKIGEYRRYLRLLRLE